MIKEGYLLVVILREVGYLEPILDALMEVGISGVTVLSSRGISADTYRHHIEEFSIATLMDHLLVSNKAESKTLVVLARYKKVLTKARKQIEKVVGDIDEPKNAIVFTIPVQDIWGIPD
ncbi:MAG: hypothetical protein B1H03_00890 [Planctomycetales bacterium 4484_113]|nr:MAG: hypothetical protein B1H03_00890 [Planctomycetales bacterium 4484_113]